MTTIRASFKPSLDRYIRRGYIYGSNRDGTVDNSALEKEEGHVQVLAKEKSRVRKHDAAV